MDHFCYLCFVFIMFSCLFIAALWSTAEKGLTSWLSCIRCLLCFWHFPVRCPVLGVVLDCIFVKRYIVARDILINHYI